MFCDRRLANYPRWFLEPPEDADMLVPGIVKRCVVFLGPPDEAPGGTGFLVSLPTEDDASRLVRVNYLVTAAHCLPGRGEAPLHARFNDRDGRAQSVELNGRWWRHPTDPTVDVAVMPVPAMEDAATEAIPVEVFIRAELFYPDGDDGSAGKLIGDGDEVFITGLFTDTHGQRRNLPVVRTGNIARLTDYEERIQTDWEHGPIVAHLIEARSRKGMSGSPVFSRRTVKWAQPNVENPSHGPLVIVGYGPDVRFLGLVHGHADDSQEFDQELNRGIAFVVPAQHILETLHHPKLVKMRHEEWAARPRVVAKPDGGE